MAKPQSTYICGLKALEINLGIESWRKSLEHPHNDMMQTLRMRQIPNKVNHLPRRQTQLWNLKPSWAIIFADMDMGLRSLNNKQPRPQQRACTQNHIGHNSGAASVQIQGSKASCAFLLKITVTNPPYQDSAKRNRWLWSDLPWLAFVFCSFYLCLRY